jgi:hypothetical protein
MNEIDKVIIKERERCESEGYTFSYTNNKNVTCEIIVDAETSGHGCLFNIYLPPKLAIDGVCFGGDIKKISDSKGFLHGA